MKQLTKTQYLKLEATGMLYELFPNGVEIVEDSFARPQDPNVASVIEKYLIRAEDGMVKYGVTTERTDIDVVGWLTNLQEELMDATIYLERFKQELL